MAIDLGFGELLDRVEKHIGNYPTKALVFAGWLAAMSFFLKSAFDYVIKPLIDVGPTALSLLSWLDAIQVALALFLGLFLTSATVDAYRMKLMRDELEDTTGRAHSLLDDIREFGNKNQNERVEMIEEVKSLIAEVEVSVIRATELQAMALMTAENIYDIAQRGESISDQELVTIKDLIDSIKAQPVMVGQL